MRPTTKDLARHAGVSRATVDRVLNARPGVQKKTIEAVNAAIAELGFERNLSAANLAKSRIYRFCFLLPKGGGEFLDELIAQIEELAFAMRAENIELSYRRELDRDPHRVVDLLSAIDPDKVNGVAILAPESPPVRDATQRLIERGIHVVELLNGQSGAHPLDVVGIENKAAGATAARLLGGFCKQRHGRVMIVAETMNSLDSTERRFGFDRVLQTRFPELTALPTLETYGDADRTAKVVARCVERFEDIVGAYVMNSEAADTLNALVENDFAREKVVVAHERAPQTMALLKADFVDALIVQNPGHVVRSAVRRLKAKCDTREPLLSQEQIRIEILLKENIDSP